MQDPGSPKSPGHHGGVEDDPDNLQGDGMAVQEDRPNVYFVYTDDGGAVRAEAFSGKAKAQRNPSARRPGTASRKGRANKKKEKESESKGLFGNLPTNPFQEEEDTQAKSRFPKARGLVSS